MDKKRSYVVPWTEVLELKTEFLICQSQTQGVMMNDFADDDLFDEDF